MRLLNIQSKFSFEILRIQYECSRNETCEPGSFPDEYYRHYS